MLVVGGGEISLRKIRLVTQAGALITAVAIKFCDDLRVLAEQSTDFTVIFEPYQRRRLAGFNPVLVIAATNDKTLNRLVSRHAQSLNMLINVVDDPGYSNVIFPSIVDRSPVQIAISSGGNAPVLVRLLRTQLEGLIPAGLGKLAALAGRFRPRVKAKITSDNERKAFWEDVFEGRIAEQAYANNLTEAARLLTEKLKHNLPKKSGEVYLVGGGPGDPDLLTFKALRLMQKADIVLYDRLISPQVLDRVRRDATRIYVGKSRASHAVTQENINQKLVDFAKQGSRVLRLKGGDPFLFGRGGEEITSLAGEGIPFQIVPGITAASGCASYAGIPLAHRDHAHSVHFIAGHLRSGTLDLNWAELVQPKQTLAFYMGLNGMETILAALHALGLDENTPAAIVENGTMDAQRVFVGNLKTLAPIVRAAKAKAPTLLIVGTVISLHSELAWFNRSD